MSQIRHPRWTRRDERFFIIRTMVAHCAPRLRTSSPTMGWHRLVATSRGVILVRTPQGDWSAPTSNAVWVPAGVRAELETCSETSLRMLYIRQSRSAWSRGGLPEACQSITVGPLMRALIDRVAALSAIDRRIAWQVALATLLLQEMRDGARTPQELAWPRDPRAQRIASLVQTDPADGRRLQELCRGQGASLRTIQRLFPRETGLTFEDWRARVRLLHASRLLAEGHKVSDVAAACGYRSSSAFVAAFTRLSGITPGRFCRN